MSTAYDGHNTFIRFAKQSAKGVAGTEFHLWDAGEADSLVFGETPDDRGILYGDRGKRRGAKRQGMQLPGGALPAYPWHQDGSSVPLGLILMNFWQGSVTSVVSAGTDGTVYRQTFSRGTQQDEANWLYLTFQKNNALVKKCEIYLDTMTDGLSLAWEAASHLKITPTVKSLTASNDGTMTGTGNPITDGFVMSPKFAHKWNGNTILPSAVTWDYGNTLPDRQSGASRGRSGMHLGDFFGKLTISVWRNSNTNAYFRAPYDDVDPTGTLISTWTIGTNYGSHCDASALSGTITTYISPDWLDTPAQAGDLIDSFTGDILVDSSMSYTTELDDI